MRLLGSLMLLSGWLIVLFAIAYLVPLHQRVLFVLAGLGVEALGLALFIQSYKSQAAQLQNKLQDSGLQGDRG